MYYIWDILGSYRGDIGDMLRSYRGDIAGYTVTIWGIDKG